MAKIETARLIVADRYDSVLLAQRPFASKARAGQLDFFGGQKKKRESVVDAALRELEEESGFILSTDNVFKVYEVSEPDGPDTYLRHYFGARVERLPYEQLREHIGSVVLPQAMAMDLLSFQPHKDALAEMFDACPAVA